MAKRSEVKSVTLTPEQREGLERLWFYFGNYGPKTTPGNHSFIQRLLENGIDERSLHTKRTPKLERPTPECERAVEKMLSLQTELESQEERIRKSGLRVISKTEERKPSEVDPEMRAILDDMKRHYSVMRARLEDVDNTPDAA